MRRLRVLVADDHRLILEAIRLVLDEAEDIEVVGEATNGSQVLPLIGQTTPDLVLLDISMPGMDGLTCLDRIQKQHPGTSVVILSSHDDPETIASALARGAKSFIGKMVDPRDLPSALRLIAQGAVYRSVQAEAPSRMLPAQEAGLTPSEQRVLEALSRGLSNKEIAAELWLTQQTVKFHLTNIYRRLGVGNRTEAMRYAYKHRLVAHPFFEPAAEKRLATPA
ncbi:MAG TPA: response regulator transcription factor [Gaiellaceae bacterium]|nr:response regulator transcription factor [Gaiellaceae bacterium]